MGGETAAIIRIVEDLPAPLGPRKPKASPRCTVTSMPLTASKEPKRLVSPRASTMVAGRSERLTLASYVGAHVGTGVPGVIGGRRGGGAHGRNLTRTADILRARFRRGYPGAMPDDGSHLRISDDDRHAVAEILRDAAGQGRLGIDELEERLEATYAARTYGDLAPLTDDLPDARPPGPPGLPAVAPGAAAPRPAPVAHGPVPLRGSSYAFLSSVERRGVWQPDGNHTAVAFWGAVVLDLREARWSGDLVVDAYAVMGSVEVIVDAGTAVRVDGVGVLGDFSQGRDKVPAETGPASRQVTVRGLALMGSVAVQRRKPPGPPLGQRLREHFQQPAPRPVPPPHLPPHLPPHRSSGPPTDPPTDPNPDPAPGS